MSFSCEEVIELAKGVVLANQPQDLVRFREPDCAAAIWQRRFMPEFQAWLDHIAPSQLPETRIVLSIDQVYPEFCAICDECGLPDSRFRELFINDVDALAQLFASLLETKFVRLRLEKVTDNACSKFHRDNIKARLVCTYRGKATQYGTSVNAEEPVNIFTAQTGAPMLLRGKLWPEQPATGLVHRSPPIEGSAQTRLLLVIDPAYDPAGDM